MADIYTVPELTWTTTNFSVPNLNQYLRDNMQALRAGLTDSSADSDIFQAIKSGNLSARPAGTVATAGRQYYATDIRQTFIVDGGGAWQHVSGTGAFDSFARGGGDLTAFPTADSGHTWVENEGDLDLLLAGTLNSTTVSPSATATVDTGAPLRTAHYGMTFQCGSAAANLTASIVLRWASLTTNLYVQANGAASQLQLVNNIGALTDTPIATESFTFVANAFYFMEVFVRGPVVIATVRNNPTTLGTTGDNPVGLTHAVLAETFTGSLATATRAGVRFGTGGAGIGPINDWFCIPNA